VFADEATWGGDVRVEGILKALITEVTFRSTRKFCETEKRINRMHLTASSNNDWVVQAGPSARRFVPLDTDSKYVGDTAYWSELAEHLATDRFRIALLCYLDRYVDLTEFVPRSALTRCSI